MSLQTRVLTAPPLVEQVYELIVEEICCGEITSGEALRQEAIAERFGVSRQPVQQALVLLKRHGLVRDSGRRGVEVVPIDADYVNDLCDMRALLDVHATRRAASVFDPAHDGQALAAVIERGNAAAEARAFSDMVIADVDFHHFFYRMTDNPLLLATAELLSQRVRRIMAEVLTRGGIPAWVWTGHEEIFRAVQSGTADRAVELAGEHVERARSMMLASLSGAGVRR